jgi:uncharacterized protein YndB with AHSA1/START domain
MASIRLSRVVSAPPLAVFAAFTEPAEIRKWHVPGPDFTVCIADVDPRIGGQYRVGMQPPDRDAPYTFSGECREVSAPSRLVYTCRWEPPERDMGESLVTIEIQPKGDATEVVVVHDLLPDQQAADDHTRGWTGTLESLARHFG